MNLLDLLLTLLTAVILTLFSSYILVVQRYLSFPVHIIDARQGVVDVFKAPRVQKPGAVPTVVSEIATVALRDLLP